MTVTPRVLHVAQPADGGAARCVGYLAADQARRGWEVAVAAGPDGALAGWVASAGVQHLPWTARRDPSGVVGEARDLRRIVEHWAPDLVHLHSSKAGLAGRVLPLGARRIFQPHGWSFHALTGLARRLALEWERLALARSDSVVCVSEAERREIGQGGVRRRCRVVPNGVDLEHFRPGPTAPESRRALGLAAVPLAVCVGRLCRQKGQDQLLAIWPRVRARVPDAELALVGDGPWRSELADGAPAGVRLVGQVDDVRPWLDAADLVVAASRWEGMPLALLEAMACARPIVATDVGGVREVLGDGAGGPAGVTVSSGDPAGFTDAVVSLLRDPPRAVAAGRKGRARAEDRFALDASLQGIADVSLETLGEGVAA